MMIEDMIFLLLPGKVIVTPRTYAMHACEAQSREGRGAGQEGQFYVAWQNKGRCLQEREPPPKIIIKRHTDDDWGKLLSAEMLG